MIPELLPAIEAELQRQLARLDEPRTRPFYEMLTYHMGWTGESAGQDATGKRIRPVLLVMSYCSTAPDAPVASALPAAAAVELIHNFSLVHDDIEDNSPRRRGRPTIWKKWGVPMAINAGDALFVIANQATMDLIQFHPAPTVALVAAILHDTCLDLTRGQYLDMAFEERNDLNMGDYWPMIGGKTAALLSACCRIGATLAGASEVRQEAYGVFGYNLGLAFQVRDDILGIWGDEARTGKSTASDLVEGKNSLPILYGLMHSGRFAKRWKQGPIQPEEVREVVGWLDDEGALGYAQERAHHLTNEAIKSLHLAEPSGTAGAGLLDLANKLLERRQ
jgi:geranylgeranyl diphosphate synthase type I